jgi:hypothetical protein
VRLQPKSETGVDVAERIKSILETRNLTLYQLSQRLEATYGHASLYSLPHNLYYGLKLGTFSPSLYELFALSRISDYRMTDWLRVFGFDLEVIPWLQVFLPTTRTILLDSSLSDPNTFISWFRDKRQVAIPPIAPLSQLLEAGPLVRHHSLLEMNKQRFLYAKIGFEDDLAFPDLLPGSIVRIDPRLKGSFPEATRMPSNQLFLVEHGSGLCCCRLAVSGENRILPVSTHLPYAQVELQLHREARVLGTVDLEIRSLTHVEQAKVPKDLAKRWKPTRLPRGNATLSRLLGAARLKTGLSLREASAMSRLIATMFDDKHYFMSPSSLSDYEARDTPPHHIQKVITLSLIYAVPFRTFLNTVGIPTEKAGQEPIPDRFISRVPPVPLDDGRIEPHEHDGQGFLRELLRRCEQVPVFLRGAISNISGLASPSLRSLFWIGGIPNPLHPYLVNGLIASVDRHKQKPLDSRSRPPWQQSLYIVLKRDGTYLCGPCGIENGTLVMHPDAEHLDLREQFRNRRDAEVVGQVTAIVRKLV